MRRFHYIAVVTLSMTLLAGTAGFTWTQRPEQIPEFSSMQPQAKKQAFFAFLQPKIQHANNRIARQRAWLMHAHTTPTDAARQPLSWFEQRKLRQLAQHYGIDWTGTTDQLAIVEGLLNRVDEVPASLALVQAAKESGWGTSRFALAGNNWFGQQCFREGCGHVPVRRAADGQHEVARFPTVQSAVDAYMLNLNAHYRYQDFRDLRAQSRGKGNSLKGTELAAGLLAYSERREAYVAEIIDMIEYNELE